jgi:glucokinase
MADEAIGLDIGGTRMRVARITADGRILDKKIVEGCRDPERALDKFCELIRAFDGPNVRAVGLGVPGRVDARSGAVLSGGFLDLSSVDVKGRIEREFGRPVRIENDCSMALIAEARVGAAKGLANVVMLTIGTGIGGAAMLDGRIVNGKQAAGQLGHIVVQADGPVCVCGQAGCVELYSSGTALGRLTAEAGLPAGLRCEEILERAASGEERHRALLGRWAGPLRAAINTLSATFDPDVLLLGGGLGAGALGALDFAPAIGRWYQTPVRAAALGDDAGMIGAGLAALELAAPFRSGKKIVLVNGVPASGKSRVASRIADRLGWQMLSLDMVKNPFLAELDNVDRLFNRRLGKASYRAIWDIIAAAPPGAGFVIDAWFGFQPLEQLDGYFVFSGVDAVAELWCSAPPEVIGDRYRARLAERLPGHPGESYVPELIDLARRAAPTGRAPSLTIDTTTPLDEAATLGWLGETLNL